MRISAEALTDFRQLYLAQHGQELSEELALEKATRLLRLMELIYEPMTKADYDEIKIRQAIIRASESYRSRQLVA